MRIPRIFIPLPLKEHSDLVLTHEATNHVVNVLRMRMGGSLYLFNGEGGHFTATLMHIEKKVAHVHIGDQLFLNTEPSLHVHIGQGLSRGERMDYAIQKSVECGVAAITPLFTTRSEVKLDKERSEKRQQHWQQVAISACEQCHRDIIPQITPPQSISEFIEQAQTELKLILHHESPAALQQLPPPRSITVLIGPEGGLTSEEISLAQQHGFIATQLGPRILRTETAPVVALSVFNTLWGNN